MEASLKLWARVLIREGWVFFYLIAPLFGLAFSLPHEDVIVVSVGEGLLISIASYVRSRSQGVSRRRGRVSDSSPVQILGHAGWDLGRPLILEAWEGSETRVFLLTARTESDARVWDISQPRALPLRRIRITATGIPDALLEDALLERGLKLLPQSEATDEIWISKFS